MSENGSESSGLACHRDCVVVNIRSYRFPNRCLITDDTFDGDHPEVDFYTWDLPLSETAEDVKEFVKSEWTLGPVRLRRILIRAPLKAQYQNRSKTLAWLLMITGTVILSAGVIMAVVGFLAWQWPWIVIPIPLVIGAATIAIGVRVLMRYRKPLSIRRFVNGYLWIRGVHSRIRDALPPWQDSAEFTAHQRRLARGRLGLGAVALIVGLLYAAVQYQNLLDAIGSSRWQSVQGTITSSEVHSVTSGDGRSRPRRTEYEIEVSYSFRVAGLAYTGTRMGFSGSSRFSDSHSATRHKQTHFNAGTPVTVYYDADAPARCALRPATPGQALQLAMPMILALVIAAGCFITSALILLPPKEGQIHS